jgi:hypothetical protein
LKAHGHNNWNALFFYRTYTTNRVSYHHMSTVSSCMFTAVSSLCDHLQLMYDHSCQFMYNHNCYDYRKLMYDQSCKVIYNHRKRIHDHSFQFMYDHSCQFMYDQNCQPMYDHSCQVTYDHSCSLYDQVTVTVTGHLLSQLISSCMTTAVRVHV